MLTVPSTQAGYCYFSLPELKIHFTTLLHILGACTDGHVDTDCYLPLITARIGIPAGASEKVSSDLRLGVGFGRVFQFPPVLTAG